MFGRRQTAGQKMRVSFDLDEVLFVNPATHSIEKAAPFPLSVFFRERLRKGAPNLIHRLQNEGFQVWVYTSSFRTERYIKWYFAWYHVKFDGIVNGQRHQAEVQRDKKATVPTKLPNHYRISLHIDDESVVCSYGKAYGFEVYQLFEQDKDWAQKILERVQQIKRRLSDMEKRENRNSPEDPA